VPTLRYNDRPYCQTPGCNNPAHIVKDYYDGWANYRKVCGSCHLRLVAKKNGKTVTQLVNSWHPYLRYRKDYCENTDSRLGFKCTTTIHWDGMLDVDHINGNPSDNRKVNLQTLCKCCHAFKTVQNRDYLTPGRKALKLAA
jgi:hypothetical protein